MCHVLRYCISHIGDESSACGFFCSPYKSTRRLKMLGKSKTRFLYALPEESTIELTNKCFTQTEKSAFSLWDLLETQLSKVDPKNEPEIYESLSSIADEVFNLWMSITGSAKDYDLIEILMFLERET